MKNFFLENARIIGKLIRTHLVMTIFGLMVFIPFNLDNGSMQVFLILGSIAAVLLYLFLIDVDMWYLGAEDAIKSRATGIRPSASKGFLIGLAAQLPSVILGILYSVFSMLYAYYMAYPSGEKFAAGKIVTWLLTFIWDGMYLGIERILLGGTVPLFYLLIPLLPIGFTGLTYYLGTKESKFLKPPEKEKRRK